MLTGNWVLLNEMLILKINKLRIWLYECTQKTQKIVASILLNHFNLNRTIMIDISLLRTVEFILAQWSLEVDLESFLT